MVRNSVPHGRFGSGSGLQAVGARVLAGLFDQHNFADFSDCVDWVFFCVVIDFDFGIDWCFVYFGNFYLHWKNLHLVEKQSFQQMGIFQFLVCFLIRPYQAPIPDSAGVPDPATLRWIDP